MMTEREVMILKITILLKHIRVNYNKDNVLKEASKYSNDFLKDWLYNLQHHDEYYEEEESDFFEYDDYHYTSSCTYGDYSPSCPWNAPGMSIHDFT